MEYPNFCGQSYASTSPQLDVERSMNLFPEVVNLPGVKAKSKINLRRRPGYNLLQTVGDTPGRGKFSVNGRDFAIAGQSFFECTSPTTSVLRGLLASSTATPVRWATTETQLLILADGLGYLFTFATNAFQQVALPATFVSITSLDTYFVGLAANSNEFFISGLLDGTTWNAINFGSSQEPDNAVAIIECHLYLWILGNEEIILFQDSGNASFPITRVPGTQIEMGCGAVGSVVLCDNTVFWLGAGEMGGGIVFRADGLLPTRISTHAVETAIQSYPTYSDAIATVYQRDGHTFYSLHFPSANNGNGATWTYDVSTGMWHERGQWNTAANPGAWSADLGRYVSYCFGKHLVVDYSSGNIYEMTRSAATDNGAALRWLRVTPFLNAENITLFFRWLQIDMQVGGGLPAGADPQVMLRWSNDGGENWSNYRQVSCGKVGKFLTRVIFRLLGSARVRAFEVSGTDPIPDLCIMGAFAGVDKGLS